MKWLFLLLLLANGLFYGYTRLNAEPASLDPKQLEIQPDAVQIAAAVIPAPATSPDPPPSAPIEVAAACYRWTGLNAEAQKKATQILETLKLSFRNIEGDNGSPKRFWVYVPPRPKLDEAQRKAKELATLGVQDYFVVNDGGRWQNALSLGLFSSRESAERRLEELKQKGVRSAIIRERDDGVHAATLLLDAVPEAVQAQLEAGAAKLGKLEKLNRCTAR